MRSTTGVLVAALALLAGCAAAGSSGGDGTTSSSRGLCEARMQHDGMDYVGFLGLVRDPDVTGEEVDVALQWCDDTGRGTTPPDTPASAAVLTDLPADLALVVDSTLYVRVGRELPRWTDRWFTEPTCRRPGTFDLVGDWTGVDGGVLPEGGYEPPYRAFVHVTDGPQPFLGARIKVRVTAATEVAMSGPEVAAALQRGDAAVVVARCVNGYVRALSFRPRSPQP
ncbi:hypothetical protein KDN32_13890 [Nocardioides sp. J2M5]|uniref:hypothetical protein n=1 Tax=Nocardioides palaemonis TaxID=2829810 RepID=UPI001BA6412A|nr:hypothetical protein [Nocardioides palaemonis]MBS2938829.1 hypothetical protein [Nocardioides palaemonis]